MWRCAVKKLALLAGLVLAPSVWACWQINDSPVTLHNTDIKVRFAYEGKAMAGDPVTLWSRKKGTLSRASTDKEGWCVFKDLPVGEYKVVLQSPSYEPFDVLLAPSGNVKTWVAVDFVGDYCRSTRVYPER
jgi:hypothetical protein